MKLTKLRLENFRCFSALDCELHSQLTVLVAENGQGKSSLLDAIRIALWPFVSSFDLARNAFNDPNNAIPIDDVRLLKLSGGDMARQLPTQVLMTGDFGSGQINTWIRYRDNETKKSKTKDDGDTGALKKWASALQVAIRNENKPAEDLPVFGYYGTGRLWAQKRLTESSRGKDDTLQTDFFVRTYAYLNCLDPASSFKHFKEWFIWAFESYREAQIKLLEGKGSDNSVKLAQAPILVIQNVIDVFLKPTTGWHTLEYSLSQEKSLILHHDEHGILKVDLLSDGIRSMLAMVGDIAFRCIKLNPHFGERAALETSGVVLIDEIDMHLHPTWQQTILNQFQAAFPLIQFIVTTHSPQVISTVKRENIRIICEVDSTMQAVIPDFNPLAQDADDALTHIMGTHSRPDMPVLEKVREYEQFVLKGEEDTATAQAISREIKLAGYQIPESDLITWKFLANLKIHKGT